MRVERPGDRRFARWATALATLAAAAVGVMSGGWPGGLLGLAAGAAVGAALLRALGRRAKRRRNALATPFPKAWRTLLLRSYDHFERLDAAWRARFEDDLRLFLADKRITGVGVEVDDELRLLVAASAATLSLGWPDYEWDQLTEVLLYPDDFDRDYRFGGDERAGEAHPWGTVILSVPALVE
ncbi:MAG TPA: zinc-dependent peptidase, partial [Vicinamibacteria bacterium]|nr:zinc-dependent peptidase [Vicinamibacteria bacterium]